MYKLSQTNLFFSRFEGTRGEKYKYLAPKFRAKMMMVMVWLFGTLVALPNLISFHVSILGLYWTSRPLWKSGKFSKSELSQNWTFSFPDARLLTLLKIEKNNLIF